MAQSPDDGLSAYPVTVEIPVQWGEMDAYGHVNNTVFFRYFETARIAYLDRCGFLEAYQRLQVGPILHSTECRFWRPLHYPDTIVAAARALQIDADRFTMGYAVFSKAQSEIVADGRGIVVSFDYANNTKTPLPDSVRVGIDGLES